MQLNNNRQHDDQPQRAVQPAVQHELVGAVHAAAAAQLQDRLDAPAARRSPRSTATSRTSSCRRRSPTRCRTSATPTGTTCSRSQAVDVAQQSLDLAEQAGAGQPDARRSRHDGADRRRPGAVASRRRGARAWSTAAGDAAHDRAGAEAADRQRHGRSELERGDRSDRSARLPARADRHRGGGPPRARASAPTSTSRKKNIAGQRRHAEVPAAIRCCRRPTSSARYGLHRPRRHAAHHDRHRRQPRRDRHAFPAATATRSARCSATTIPTWNVALNFSYPLGTELAGGVGGARARAAEPGAGAAEADRAAGRDRRHQRGDSGAEQRRSACRRRRRRASSRSSKLEAEQSKFEVGMSTNYFVVQAQRDLADAQNNELRAISTTARRSSSSSALQQTTLQNAEHHDSRPVAQRPRAIAVHTELHEALDYRHRHPRGRRRRRLRATTRSGRADAAAADAASTGGGRGGRGGQGGGGGSAAAASAGRRLRRRRRPRLPMTVELAPVKRGDMSEQITVVGNLIGAATVEAVPKVSGRLEDGLRAARRSREPRPAARQGRGPRDPRAGQAGAGVVRRVGGDDPPARGRPQARADEPRSLAQPVRAPADPEADASTTPRRATRRRWPSSISPRRSTRRRRRGSTS